jgi:mono/diheme cytochrome c family protein
MINNRLARPALALVAIAAIGACSKGSSTTQTGPTPASSAAPAAAPVAAKPFTAAMVALGDSIYHARGCRNCHGADAKGATNGPALINPKPMHVNGTFDDYVRIITSGIPADQIKDPSHRVAMPPRGGGRPAPLTDDQIKDVAAYVYSLNHP